MLSQEAKVIDPDMDIVDHDLRIIFQKAVMDYKRTAYDHEGARYFQILWDEISPKGNIYRRNAIFCEHRLHSEDLWKQMYAIADEHKILLGASLSTEQRAEELYNALRESEFELPIDEEERQVLKGYMPLEEFLKYKVVRYGPFVVFEDTDLFRDEVKHRLISWNVFLLQVIAPFLIFLNRWNNESNHLRNIIMQKETFHRHLEAREVFCLGTNLDSVLTTILGCQLLIAVIFIVSCYVDSQHKHINKMRRLAVDTMWFLMDVFANAWCAFFLVLDIPLLFWSESSPTNIVLDSMTLIFLFKLDDLSEDLCKYVGLVDDEFNRLASWYMAFLSQCPLVLSRVINPNAKSKKDLWKIQYDKLGNLVGADGEPCRTRLQHVQIVPDERTCLDPLSSADQPELTRTSAYQGKTMRLPSTEALMSSVKQQKAKIKLMYHRSRDHEQVLPSTMAQVIAFIWWLLHIWIRVANIAIPIFWYFVNKLCYGGPEKVA